MKPVRLILCISALAFSSFSSVEAQDTGSLVRRAPGQIPDGADKAVRAQQGMYNFAACVIARSPKAAQTYLETVPASAEASKLAKRMSDGDCLDGGGLVFDEPVFRGAVYHILYAARYGRAVPGDFTTSPPVDYAFGMNPVDADDRQAIALRRFADCVTRAAPVEVHSLTVSRPASKLEIESLQSLMSKLSGCLSKDLTIKFSKVQLRGVLGETLYRIRVGGEGGK